MYVLYSLALACVLLVSLPWWALQVLRLGKYRAGLSERLGFVPPRLRRQAKSGSVWIHAVSVGEVLAVSQLVAELKKTAPQAPVFVSTTTATGQKLARERFGEDQVFFMPLDFGLAVRAYLDLLRPSLLILAETEFWPNLLHLARKRGSPIAIVNARVSDRSFPRYRRFRRLFARVLAEVDLFLAQTEEDARRLREIGAAAERVQVSGNLKFDVRSASVTPLQEALRRAFTQDAPVIVCGSTAEGEEGLLLQAFQEVLRKHPSAVMVLAPRHPERFDRVAGLVTDKGMALTRRSSFVAGKEPGASSISGSVFLLDSLGELASVYALASVAFVGGSLLPGVGGHNILEPAQHGVPVLAGPYTGNFREIVSIFERGDGIKIVNAENLSAELLGLLADGQERQRLGQRARELFLENTGATARTLQALQNLLRRQPATAP
ncbi:MAG TPA: 3-deoxy-D-manno-octulosonic acid transferase [Candidatus Angelobacter sp.]